MVKNIFGAAAALCVLGTGAMAWESQVVACYDTVLVPAQYEVHETLVRAAHTKWEHRNGQAVRVHYPAV